MRGGSFEALGLGTSVLRSGGPPPELFIPKAILSAWVSSDPHARTRSASSSTAQRLGLSYQKKIEKFVRSNSNSWDVKCGVWFCYHDDDRRRFCQPDILLDDAANKVCVIVETKLRWTANAWWQLRRLYEPVLRHVRGPDWTLILLCITKSFDPAVGCPEEVNLCDDLFDARPDRFNVLVVR